MTRTNESAGRPSVEELFAQYLRRQIDAHAQGLGYAEVPGEAVPHDAVPVQPVDPALAWKDAVAAAKLLEPSTSITWTVPPEWPALVAQQPPAVALVFCLGNYPQLVRNLHPLLTREPAALRDVGGPAVRLTALDGWIDQGHAGPQRLLAGAVARLARRFDTAEELLAGALEGWGNLHANEVAALAWHRGQGEKALALWQAAPETAVVLFNRGMALLFLGRPDEAVEPLNRASSGLPESSPWYHLAQLYLALATAQAE